MPEEPRGVRVQARFGPRPFGEGIGKDPEILTRPELGDVWMVPKVIDRWECATVDVGERGLTAWWAVVVHGPSLGDVDASGRFDAMLSAYEGLDGWWLELLSASL